MKTFALIENAGIAAQHVVLEFASRRGQPAAPRPLRVVVQSTVDDEVDRAAFRAGLLATPAVSSPKFFYDPQGAALFSAICELDEYYPTRTEAAIFERHRIDIAKSLPSGGQWIDLGCGDGLKARGWLQPAQARRYVGVDIAEPWLRSALDALAATLAEGAHPIDVMGVVTDFTRPFDLHDVLAETPKLAPVFFYPGSSIGNFVRDDARAFLASVRDHIERHPAGTGGKLMIGIDLVKDRADLRAAYDDAIGVTAAFNRNVLRVANRLLDADFDPAAFAHRAVYNETYGRIEMQLVALREQVVRIGDATRVFAVDEAIVTEYSHKYTVDGFTKLLESAGFAGGDRLRCWQDGDGRFGVFVAEPA
ncbi:MAG: L-histidine N(alpha)-methyltransferase [Burkholderiaceae bacterium]